MDRKTTIFFEKDVFTKIIKCFFKVQYETFIFYLNNAILT